MLENLLQNPAFLISAFIAALIVIVMNVMLAAATLRGRKDKIEEAFNRDKKAMDELRKRVEELEKK